MVLAKPVRIDPLINCLSVALNLELASPTSPSGETGTVELEGKIKVGRILLAEDNLVNQKVAIAMLSSVGYDVETVDNGTAAVSEAMSENYDVILMDCQMPGMNGYDATAAIRAQEGSSGHVPIIALTASARTEDRERCLAGGMDDYLSKPISKVDLLAVVASYVEKSTRSKKALGPAVDPPGGELEMQLEGADGEPVVSGTPSRSDTIKTDQPILDATILDQLDQLGVATGERLVEALTVQFLLDADVQMAELAAAFATGDSELLVRSAHQLRGASANMGATELAQLCALFDSAETDRVMCQDESVLASIASELVRVRNALHLRIASQ
jgi:CheY-like chemotaxis protein/HPt (histidine-containing phosphotransfer) domain-containing protein